MELGFLFFHPNIINMHFDSFLSLNKKYGNRTLSTLKTNWYLDLMIKSNCHGANGYNLKYIYIYIYIINNKKVLVLVTL